MVAFLWRVKMSQGAKNDRLRDLNSQAPQWMMERERKRRGRKRQLEKGIRSINMPSFLRETPQTILHFSLLNHQTPLTGRILTDPTNITLRIFEVIIIIIIIYIYTMAPARHSPAVIRAQLQGKQILRVPDLWSLFSGWSSGTTSPHLAALTQVTNDKIDGWTDDVSIRNQLKAIDVPLFCCAYVPYP